MAAARRYGQQQVDKPKARNDAYTGLLGVSLVAMLIGCLLLFLDYNSYELPKPPKGGPQLPAIPKMAAIVPPAAPRDVVPVPPKDKKVEPAKKVEAKKEEPKKEEPKKKDEAKKDDAKKDEPKKKDDAKKDEKKDDAKKKDEK